LLFAAAVLTAAPLAVVFSAFAIPADDVWRHFAETILGEIVFNTLALAAGVGIGCTIFGAGLAWLTAVCEFPGRRFFSWALLLPLAMPAYVMAFIAIGLLDFAGPVQSALRELTGSPLHGLPQIRSRGGVIAVMTLALYPYVYLLARNAFATQGRTMLEAGRVLGLSAIAAFFRVALPMARPWIAAGVALVLMETLADFGTVAAFNYDTLTTAVYKAWYGLFSLPAASQLASLLVVIAFVALAVEQATRRNMRFTHAHGSGANERMRLSGWHAWLASTACALVFAAGFAVPVLQLALWIARSGFDIDARYLASLWRSLALAGLAALSVCALAVLLGYAGRRDRSAAARAAIRIATLGYAVPGAVLAVGIFSLLARVDASLSSWLGAIHGMQSGALLQGSVAAMIAAYVIRFLAVGFAPVDSALNRITRNMEEAAVSLGHTGWKLLSQLHLPLLRGGLSIGAILVFVDVMKEMPITLMTRPFGWDTLAVRIFELTSEGQWQQAALPSLALVAAGILPVIQLARAAG
jgi:iron(III) transport system permease protein